MGMKIVFEGTAQELLNEFIKYVDEHTRTAARDYANAKVIRTKEYCQGILHATRELETFVRAITIENGKGE